MCKKKRLLHLSYAQKIMVSLFVVILLLSVFLSASLQHISGQNFAAMEQQLLVNSLDSMLTRLDSALSAVHNATTPILNRVDIPTLYALEAEDKLGRMVNKRPTREILWSIVNSNYSLSDSAIPYLGLYLKNDYNVETGTFLVSPGFSDFEECCKFLQEHGISDLSGYIGTLWFDSATVNPQYYVPQNCLIGVRFIYEQVTLDKIGVIVIAVSENSIRNIFASVGEPMCLMRQDGTVLVCTKNYSLDKHAEYLETLQTQMSTNHHTLFTLPDGRYAYAAPIQGGCRFVCIADFSAQSEMSRSFGRQAILITAIALVAGLLLTWLCSHGLTGSLRKLTGTVQQIYSGDLSARFHTNQDDEIAYLGRKINDMMEQVEDSMKTQQRDAAIKRDLELQLAHAQINPHLLYNTLNSVAWRIRQNDPDKATQLLFALSSFFRLTLSKGQEEITLDDELAMIRHYLQIQNLGRGKAYSLRDEVPEQWRTCKVLRLTLQPLVENSIVHGLTEWRDDGVLTITAEPDETGNALCIHIRDNGIGIPEQELQQMQRTLSTYPPTQITNHYGLYNIQQRIKMKYGPQYGMTLASEVGVSTEVTITYPIHKEGNHA